MKISRESKIVKNLPKVILNFLSAIDIPSKWDLSDLTFSLLSRSILPIPDLLDRAIILYYQSLMWDAKRLTTNTQVLKDVCINHLIFYSNIHKS